MKEREDPPTLAGPLENGAFPERLTARVVTPGARPRIHGYDVEGDLALHYGPSEVLALSLTGELPSPQASAALAVALTFLAPVSIADAPAHGAALSHLCGSTLTATVGVAAIGLAEQARCLVDEHRALFRWLESPRGLVPEACRARGVGDSAAVDRLRAALLATELHVPGLDASPSLSAALLLVLHAVGLRRPEEIATAIVTARLPTVVAEALSGKPVDFRHYPINLPRFRYEES